MPPTSVHRIEVRAKREIGDPRSDAASRAAAACGIHPAPMRVEVAAVYLLEGSLDEPSLQRIARELLADPVTEQATIGAEPTAAGASTIEVHPLPGVMDPDAEAIAGAIRTMLEVDVSVRTGRRYDMADVDGETAVRIAERCFANRVIHGIMAGPYHPTSFPSGRAYELKIIDVPIRDLDGAGLEQLSRDAHLFLALEEMQAIQAEYRRLGREPREIELETLAQTWSEHCVHKTLKATIRYREVGTGAEDALAADGAGGATPRRARRGLVIGDLGRRPGHTTNGDGSVTIHNLLRSTVAAATHELIDEGIDWCLSVFVDNAGIVRFDDEHAVCFKVETHNHPSAIEPYGGAATGIGGVIRDIIGTGLAAKPIAATDVFCVAYPDHFETRGATEGHGEEEESGGGGGLAAMPSAAGHESARSAIETASSKTTASPPSRPSAALRVSKQELPSGCLHPRRILTQVVAGVRDYGNRMGIPTLNGAVWFDDDYVGNPLVYCGCVGVMPIDLVGGEPRESDRIIALGGRTGRDGIHGATFSSAELTDTHADEFSHAVQIGNAVTEKKLLDAILEARDCSGGPLFHAITDCGAGGFSSAVGEMGEALGAMVHLESAPLKYAGLSPTEIWISEAQERMVLAVPQENVERLRDICDLHDVELCDLGHFGTPGRDLILTYEGTEVGRLPMQFLHEGLPQPQREAVWEVATSPERAATVRERPAAHLPEVPALDEALLALLAHPNIASKRWIIRQYDHEVQGRSVVKPLVGIDGEGPSDAAVILPVAGSTRGLAIANGLATGLRDDPYLMTLAAIDECVRNLICVGTDPSRIAILDNFCWPSCRDPRNLGSLVRAAEACYDGAKAYRTPFISGKDSLNNQFTTESGRTIRIPPTLLISGFGIVADARRCVTMDAKRAGDVLVLVGETQGRLGGSHYEMMFGAADAGRELPEVDLDRGPAVARAVAGAIGAGLVAAAHDCSEGGVLVAAAEMAFAGGLGLTLDVDDPSAAALFDESPSRYLLEVASDDVGALRERLRDVPHDVIGRFDATGRLRLADVVDMPITDLRSAWLGTLDW